MTFEVLMAAMAFAARVNKFSGNEYNSELEDRLNKEHQTNNLRALDEERCALEEMYPGDFVSGTFFLKCRVYIPLFDEDVLCLIYGSEITVFKHIPNQHETGLILLSPVFGPCYYDDDYIPQNLYDRTAQINKEVADILGKMISSSICYLLKRNKEAEVYEREVNNQLKRWDFKFIGRLFAFNYTKELSQGQIFPLLYEFATTDIDLKAPPIESAAVNIPVEVVKYSGRDYIVIPYSMDASCLCVTCDVIFAFFVEELHSVVDKSITGLSMRAEVIEPFTGRKMNRTDKLDLLDEEDKGFYFDVFRVARDINKYIEKYPSADRIRLELLEILIDGIVEHKFTPDQISNQIKKIGGSNYSYVTGRIIKKGQNISLYDFCKDSYKMGGK